MDNILKILELNPNGLRLNQRKTEIELMLNKLKHDIIFLVETKFLQTDIFNLKFYNIFRNDRHTNQRLEKGGTGTAILINKKLNYTAIDFPINICKFEFTIGKINIDMHNSLILISLYCRQNTIDFSNNLNNLITKIRILFPNQPMVIGGDFNAKHTSWKDIKNNYNGIQFSEFLENPNFSENLIHIAPTYPTFIRKHMISGSHIDHFLVNNKVNPILNAQNKANTLDFFSDHAAISITIEIPNFRISRNINHNALNLVNTDWYHLKKHLDTKFHQNLNIPININMTNSEIDTHIIKFNDNIICRNYREVHTQTECILITQYKIAILC